MGIENFDDDLEAGISICPTCTRTLGYNPGCETCLDNRQYVSWKDFKKTNEATTSKKRETTHTLQQYRCKLCNSDDPTYHNVGCGLN